MAEEADKIDLERAEARVVQLRLQIASKRAALGAEIEELRRRRRSAIERGKKLGQAVGIGAVGMVLLGSLTNAVIDLFSSEQPQRETLRQQAPESSATAGVIGLAFVAVRWVAKEWLRSRLREAQERQRSDRKWFLKYGDGNGFSSSTAEAN